MLCDTCKNKYICKYYEYLHNASIKLVVQVNECELFSGNQPPVVYNPCYKDTSTFRQPLPSRPVDEEKDILEEDEEKVFVDISSIDNTPSSTSIVDLLMKGELEHDEEEN